MFLELRASLVRLRPPAPLQQQYWLSTDVEKMW